MPVIPRQILPVAARLLVVAALAGPAPAWSAPAAKAPTATPAAAGPVGRVPRVPWLHGLTWDEVCARAQADGRPIIIDFMAPWCGPCRLLDVMVFTERPVIDALADAVTFQVDIDRPEYRQLQRDLGIEVVPTVVWCDPQGRPLDRFTGYVSADQFLDIVGGWRRNLTIDRRLDERRDAAPGDPGVLLDLARRQAERGHDQAAEVLYRRLLDLRHEVGRRTVVRGILGLAELDHRAGREDEARRLAARAAGLYLRTDAASADTVGRSEALLETAMFQESVGDSLGMLATYRSLAAAEPRNVLALYGYAKAAVLTGEDLEEATRAALRATVYSDEDPAIISTLADCFYWRGLYGRAVVWQEKAVAAAPHEDRYREQLQRLKEAAAADPHGMRPPVRRKS